MDVAQRRAGEANRRGNVGEAAVHQHHVRRVHGNVRPCANGNAHIRAGKRRSVVDAIADHRDAPDLLQAAHDVRLAVWQNARDHLVNACRLPDRLCRARIVARNHHDADAHFAQFRDRFGAVVLHRVRDRHHAQNRAVAAEQQGRFALAGELFRRRKQRFRHVALPLHVLHAAAKEQRTIALRRQTVAGQRGEIRHILRLPPFIQRVLHNRFRQRMLRGRFQRQRRVQQFVFADAVRRKHIRHAHLAARNCAGFVQRDNLHLAGLLQRSRRLEQDAILCANAVADHNRDGRRQPQRAWAADDQHRNRAGQRIPERRAKQQPDNHRQHGDRNHNRDEHAGHPVRDLGNRCFRRRRVGHHADNLAQRRILAHAGRLAAQEAGLIDRRRRHIVARCLIHRDALARQRRFVDRAHAVQHASVHRNAFARTHDEHVALPHLLNRQGDLLPAAEDVRRLGRELHQGFQRVGRLALAARLKHLPHRDKRQNHRGGLKIKLVHVTHDGIHIPVQLRVGHGEERIGAVQEGCG